MKIHQPIYDGVQLWEHHCFIEDTSLFGDNAVWTPEVIDEFKVLFIDNGISGNEDFFTKFERQLRPGTMEVKQFAAELLWLLHLFPSKIGAKKKEEQIKMVWSWSGQPFPENPPASIAYTPGIGSTGTAFSTHRWREVAFLYRLFAAAKALPVDERRELLANPWDFARFVDGIEGASQRQMRHILLNLLFPSTFERISTTSHKQAIATEFEKCPEITYTEPPSPMEGDLLLDWKLGHIRNVFAEKTGRDDLDFYRPPLSSLWSYGVLADPALVANYRGQLNAHTDLLWKRFRSHATDFVSFDEPGEFLKQTELDYKHLAIEKVATGVDSLNIGADPNESRAIALLDCLKSANTNIVDYRAW
ncbi:MAG: hypothetical protein KDN22_30045, partial [Verrucomicrobiae bacterium]|nr:hypothetical protein [Verrucomicrobiae bacterium]